MSFRDRVELLEPKKIRDEIEICIEYMKKKYKSCVSIMKLERRRMTI